MISPRELISTYLKTVKDACLKPWLQKQEQFYRYPPQQLLSVQDVELIILAFTKWKNCLMDHKSRITAFDYSNEYTQVHLGLSDWKARLEIAKRNEEYLSLIPRE